ncbi:hypothetical protein OG413_40140 [Streptomyces sp. NBC_01433]|uniref:hypothetical protein n=1 Tax=Streptomyces sp. NBC_01433 TaxID=2903864 RepID=UPI002257AF5B|nr:hypothetical protein [Streptomyces sp. NBC_01433]MCX4681410.1 hypothetical protein [Streptomyces sp. NBC_01433]
MSESNDTLTALLIFAGFLHTLTLVGMILHTALALAAPEPDDVQELPRSALFLGRAPVQRAGRSTFISRLLAVSGLLLAAASAMSLAESAAPAWTAVLAVLAVVQLGSAYAWNKPGSVNTDEATEQDQPDDEHAERDGEKEETNKPGSN